MIELIEQNRAEIIALCRQYRLKSLELFGSAASGEFNPATSDVDFFYDFDSSDLEGLVDRFFEFHRDLEALLGRKVDLVSAPDAKNPYFLRMANEYRTTLYAA